MIIRIIILAFFLVIISGCHNVQGYREEDKPIATFSTSKTPQEVQECILTAWQRHPLGFGVNQQKTGKYYSVLSVSDNADVFAENDRTVVNYYSLRGTLDPWRGIKKRTAAIKSCL